MTMHLVQLSQAMYQGGFADLHFLEDDQSMQALLDRHHGWHLLLGMNTRERWSQSGMQRHSVIHFMVVM